jgi:hypothetical protein
MVENMCAESDAGGFGYDIHSVPQTDKPDF